MLFIVSNVQAQEAALFEISRNKDRHKIIYHLNTDENGNLDQQEPIGAYWRRVDDSGSWSKSLNFLERKFAYGLKFLKIKPDYVRFQFVSSDKRDFILERSQRESFAVFTDFDGNRIKIDSVYLHLEGGTFWFPNITSIKFHGQNQSGEEVVEVVRDP